MEGLRLRLADAERALRTLEGIQEERFSVIVRDATIQRFEYTFEAVWKFAREYLKTVEGILSNSPKACFRDLFSLRVLDEQETVTCLEMTDRRNETSHTYKEEVAEAIYRQIAGYCLLLRALADRIKDRIPE